MAKHYKKGVFRDVDSPTNEAIGIFRIATSPNTITAGRTVWRSNGFNIPRIVVFPQISVSVIYDEQIPIAFQRID